MARITHAAGMITVVVDRADELVTRDFQVPYYELIDEVQGLPYSVDECIANALSRRHWPSVVKDLAESHRLSFVLTNRVSRAALTLHLQLKGAA